MKKLFYPLGICIALNFACSGNRSTSNILFTNPQPEGGKVFHEFPAHMLGEYLSDRYGNMLSIRRDGIFLNAHSWQKTHIKELDSTDVLIGDSLLRDKDGTDFLVRRVGDTIYLQFDQIDTVFRFDENHILRKFKNSYIMNTREGEGWLTGKLEKKNRLLIWSYIDEKETEQLRKLSDNYIDSVPYKFHISASKFKEFLKSDGFKDADTLKLKARPRKALLKFKN